MDVALFRVMVRANARQARPGANANAPTALLGMALATNAQPGTAEQCANTRAGILAAGTGNQQRPAAGARCATQGTLEATANFQAQTLAVGTASQSTAGAAARAMQATPGQTASSQMQQPATGKGLRWHPERARTAEQATRGRNANTAMRAHAAGLQQRRRTAAAARARPVGLDLIANFQTKQRATGKDAPTATARAIASRGLTTTRCARHAPPTLPMVPAASARHASSTSLPTHSQVAKFQCAPQKERTLAVPTLAVVISNGLEPGANALKMAAPAFFAHRTTAAASPTNCVHQGSAKQQDPRNPTHRRLQQSSLRRRRR